MALGATAAASQDAALMPSLKAGVAGRNAGTIADGIAPHVRDDLVAGYKILEALSALMTVYDYAGGAQRGIVVAAPHQAPSGTPLSGGHDVHTGFVAQQLAQALGGKCVIANELRTFIDLNKDPQAMQASDLGHHLGRLAFRQADKRLKLYYQSQVFATNPLMVIEVHGHARGVFDFEISTGFQLDEGISQDRVLVAALRAFKGSLPSALARSIPFRDGPSPTVGIYPLDPEVRFAATGTHTFGKIERLRDLGVNVCGLHIEMGKALRPDPKEPGSAAFYSELIGALVAALEPFSRIVEKPVDFVLKDYLLDEFHPGDAKSFALLCDSPFGVQEVPRELVGRKIVAFCKRDMRKLGVAPGQTLLLATRRHAPDPIPLQAVQLDTVAPGCIGLAKKYRDKLGLRRRTPVYLMCRAEGASQGLIPGYISVVDDVAPFDTVKVGETLAAQLRVKARSDAGYALTTTAGEQRSVSVAAQRSLPDGRAIAISAGLARELNITYGDLVCLLQPQRATS